MAHSLSELLLALALLGGFAFSLFGWGQMLARCLRINTDRYPAYTIMLGMVTLALVGGWLNLVSLAGRAPLMLLSGVGIAWALYHLLATKWSTNANRSGWLEKVAGLVLLALGVCMAAYLLPSGVFNPHDDFHTYFVRPLRMLATGTLAGNPFDTLGIDALGVQSFLQAFFLLWAPPGWLAAFDGVFCFALSLLLLLDLRRRLNGGWLHVVTALAILIVVGPMVVNISAVYAGTVTILAVAFALLDAVLANERPRLAAVVPVGLFVAQLIALKLALIVFVLVAGGGWLLLTLLARSGQRGWSIAWPAALTAFGATLPWILLYAPLYRAWYLTPSRASVDTAPSFSPLTEALSTLLEGKPIIYGGSGWHYLLLLAILVGVLLLNLWSIRRGASPASVAVALCCGALALFAVSVTMFTFATALRYALPLVGAALACGLVIAGAMPSGASVAGRSLVGLILVLVVVVFSPVGADRMMTLSRYRTTMAFPIPPELPGYVQYALDDATGRGIRQQLQGKCDEQAAILAWTALPFHFDFQRNRILSVNEPGIDNPWLDLWAADGRIALGDYLRRHGIRYLLFDYGGYGMKGSANLLNATFSPFPVYRRIARANLAMRTAMLEFKESGGHVLYDDGERFLADLGQ